MAKPTKTHTGSVRASRSPVPPSPPARTSKRPSDYTSEGVDDHDVFLLPGSDYQIMIAITALAAVVRLFRIYQPSSVVFDEVQYVFPVPNLMAIANLCAHQLRRFRIKIP
jgi:dolichyl-phosphate-mannose-protein mannosyltransferase